MRYQEQIRQFELVAADVKKGDEVAVVGPWNFFRGDTREDRNTNTATDQYSVTYWTVAAIGKKIMRLTKSGQNAKRNVYITERRQGDSLIQGFSCFVATSDKAIELVNALHLTDEGATANFEVVYPDRLY